MVNQSPLGFRTDNVLIGGEGWTPPSTNTPILLDIWGGDEDIEEEDYKIKTNLTCPKCESLVIVYHGN